MRPIVLVVLFVASASIAHFAIGDDKPKRSAEWEVLDRFIGTWEAERTFKPTGGEAVTIKSSETRILSPGGKFLLFSHSSKDEPEAPESHSLVTYDPASKTYPGTSMFGTGRVLITGTWNDATSTMTFKSTFSEDGTRFEIRNRFVDKDHVEATGSVTNAKGELLMEQTHKMTRRSTK
jgi:hypothetical protein